MNTENVKTWVKALRSGDYKQCQRRMASADGGYCCLGVAAKIAELPVIATPSKFDDGRDTPNDGMVNYETYAKVSKWLDIPRMSGDLSLSVFSDLNDKNRYTFDQIADFIETVISKQEAEVVAV